MVPRGLTVVDRAPFPPTLQPAPRRVGALLSRPPRSALAGPDGAVRDGRRCPPTIPTAALCPGNAARRRRAQSRPTPATFAFDNDFPALTATVEAAPPGARAAPAHAAGVRPLPRPLLHAPSRPHAGRDEQPRDPRRRRRLGGRGRAPERAAGDRARAGLREQGRDDGDAATRIRTARSGPPPTCPRAHSGA